MLGLQVVSNFVTPKKKQLWYEWKSERFREVEKLKDEQLFYSVEKKNKRIENVSLYNLLPCSYCIKRIIYF